MWLASAKPQILLILVHKNYGIEIKLNTMRKQIPYIIGKTTGCYFSIKSMVKNYIKKKKRRKKTYRMKETMYLDLVWTPNHTNCYKPYLRQLGKPEYTAVSRSY